jgi:protein tyrosine phosphatase
LENAKLSIFALVRNIREQRYGGVQIDKQYEMIYKYYKDWCKEFFE